MSISTVPLLDMTFHASKREHAVCEEKIPGPEA